MRIKVPSLSTSSALSFSRALSECDQADTYYFDVSDTNNYEPLPMLLTAAAIRQFCIERSLLPWDIQLLYNDNSNYQYACHMGFFKAAGFSLGKAPGEAPGGGTYIPLERINIDDLARISIESGRYYEQGDIIEQEAQRLSKVLTQGQPELQKMLQFLLREAIRNIPEHAETKDVWLCGQYWRNRDLAEIAILDEGIGVFRSIIQNQFHRDYIKSNEDALRWAIKPGISACFVPTRKRGQNDHWANSGYGLYMISEICKHAGGWFTLVSGDDCMRIFPNNDSIYKAHFTGTALGIRIRPSKIDKYQTIIDQINKQGKEEAMALKNAFKEASISSKGLIH